MKLPERRRAPKNRTITLTDEDRRRYRPRLKTVKGPAALDGVVDGTIYQDALATLDQLPSAVFQVIIADPPYNLTKTFNSLSFNETTSDAYARWLDGWVSKLPRLLKPTGSLYLCADWRSSAAVQTTLHKYFRIQNRICWEREKGRGAKANWKNVAEDIWFATLTDQYLFNLQAVKLKRRVIAPYKDDRGRPKDWHQTADGRYRTTHPSNVWTDLTVPFWSMPENTDHPTQKPEKLIAKLLLASSNPGDVILDPFVGSGTTSVVAKKLNRHFVGIEIDREYCLLTEKRLELAEHDDAIQGYTDGVFWERNTLSEQMAVRAAVTVSSAQQSLFGPPETA